MNNHDLTKLFLVNQSPVQLSAPDCRQLGTKRIFHWRIIRNLNKLYEMITGPIVGVFQSVERDPAYIPLHTHFCILYSLTLTYLTIVVQSCTVLYKYF